MNREEFIFLIQKQNIDALIGKFESEWLECKSEIYFFSEGEKGKRELSKDISSFANTPGGGYILLGVKTEKDPTHHADRIVEIAPFFQNLLDKEQYHNIINEWIYPTPDIIIEWFDYKNGKGIGLITIPPQTESSKPFLMTKMVDATGKRTEFLFGYAERRRANSEPKKFNDIHQLIRDGHFYGISISNRFDEIATLIQRSQTNINSQEIEATTTDIIKIQNNHVPVTQHAKEKPDQEIWEKIGYAIGESELAGHRLLALTGYVNEYIDMPAWLDSKSAVVKALEHPPELRNSGWDLHVGSSQPKIIRGELRRVVEKEHKILDLYRDGTAIFAVSAASDFLAWGQKSDLKINPLSLIETVYNFASFYRVILDNMATAPSFVGMRIDLHNMHLNGQATFMVPYALGAFWPHSQYPAPSDAWNRVLKVPMDNFDVSSVAYQVVQEIYLWFGIDVDKIPYTSDRDGRRIIDPDQIMKPQG